MKKIIQSHKLDLKDIFKNFDKSGDGKLDLGEFDKLVKVIDKSLPSDEVKYIFNLFDKERSGNIDFVEFCQTLQ